MNDGYWRRFIFHEKKLLEISDYVEIHHDNRYVFSLELLTLFLSACSEIEAVYKEIDSENCKSKKNYNFPSFRLNSIKMPSINFLQTPVELSYFPIKFYPFSKIHTQNETGDLVAMEWWNDYQAVKHNREHEFNKATLENLLNAISALFLLNLYLYFYKNNSEFVEPIPQLFNSKCFYVSNFIGNSGLKYFRFEHCQQL